MCVCVCSPPRLSFLVEFEFKFRHGKKAATFECLHTPIQLDSFTSRKGKTIKQSKNQNKPRIIINSETESLIKFTRRRLPLHVWTANWRRNRHRQTFHSAEWVLVGSSATGDSSAHKPHPNPRTSPQSANKKKKRKKKKKKKKKKMMMMMKKKKKKKKNSPHPADTRVLRRNPNYFDSPSTCSLSEEREKHIDRSTSRCSIEQRTCSTFHFQTGGGKKTNKQKDQT